jgi:hypothetical protein
MAIAKPPVRPAWAEGANRTESVDPGDNFVADGFPGGDLSPVRQFLNWVLNYCTNGIRYLCRRGISDYDPRETYARYDIVRGDDGCLHQSLTEGNIGNPPSKCVAHWGLLSIYRRTIDEIAADVTPINYAIPELNVLRYGADNTGKVPCDKAILAAIAAACASTKSPTYGRCIYFPAGQYLVTSPIDLSNTRERGTCIKDGLLIKGDSIGGTRIIGKTGPGRPVIETTGSQWLTIEDLTITVAPMGHSTVGIFQGLASTLPETQNQKFCRVVISMSDDPSSNGGAGSVGIWNFGAEENTYDTVWIKANLPLMFTAHNPSPNTGFKTPTSYQALAQTHSVGLSTFVGECYFVSMNKRQPSIVTEDTNSMTFMNAYLSNVGEGGNNRTAWRVFGSLTGLDFKGLVESHATLLDVYGVVAGAKMRATFGGIDESMAERLLLRRGGQGRLLDCEISMVDSVAQSRNLLSAIPASPDERLSCYLQNCTLKANCDQRFTLIQENLLWNPSTGNLTIEALRNDNQPYRYFIDSNRTQEVAIADTACLDRWKESAELVRIVLPTIVGNRNALSATLSLNGMAHSINSAGGNMSCKFVNAQISFSVNDIGGVAVLIDTQINGSTVHANGARGGVASFAVGAIHNERAGIVRVVGSAARSSPSDDGVAFFGNARLLWVGNESRAPRLQILD